MNLLYYFFCGLEHNTHHEICKRSPEYLMEDITNSIDEYSNDSLI